MEDKKKRKILLIEDDTALIDVYKTKLESEGFEVNIAQDGEEGLELAQRDLPDLILLDILMPKMDGLTVLDKLRSESEWGKAVPIIILTNLNADDKVITEVVENKPTYYLMKANTTPQDVTEKIKGILK